MSTIRFRHAALLAVAALSFAACQAQAPEPATEEPPVRPNVLFLAVDDLRPELGAYGRSEIHSPNIDRLAAEGLLFERAYSGIPRKGDVDRDLSRELIHGYRACVSYTDTQIGKVLDELDRLGLRESTIVMLWGDHGWKLGDYGDWCKHSNFELDTRAPLIVSAPGMKTRGQSTAALVEFVDMYPTLVEMAGLPLPAHLQGTSFAPLLEDPGQAWKDVALSQYPRGTNMGRSMRTDRWRFTQWRSEDGGVIARELYDHDESDPLELRNLADDPAHAGTVKELEALLDDRWTESLR